MACPSNKELKVATRFIPIDSSPGPDGFGSSFYLADWELIRDDLLEAANEYFNGATLPRFFTTSFIVIIPKVVEPLTIEKLQPINVCLMAYKIFSKIIVGRLSGYLSQLISSKHGAFIAERSIFKNSNK